MVPDGKIASRFPKVTGAQWVREHKARSWRACLYPCERFEFMLRVMDSLGGFDSVENELCVALAASSQLGFCSRSRKCCGLGKGGNCVRGLGMI